MIIRVKESITPSFVQILFADLLDQMGYEGRMRSAQSTEDAREYIVGQQAEAEYQEKLKQCLSEPHSADHMHPMRRHYYRNQQINA